MTQAPVNFGFLGRGNLFGAYGLLFDRLAARSLAATTWRRAWICAVFARQITVI
jgi:hypothetical protein